MYKSLFLGSLSVMAIAGAAAVIPMAVDAQSATVQARGNSYGLQDGSGAGQNGSGQQRSLESRAQTLGLSAEQLQEKLQSQTMLQLAQEQGLTVEQYQAKMREAATARWQERGLNAEQVQERTEAQTARQADCDGSGDHQGQGGYGRSNRVQ